MQNWSTNFQFFSFQSSNFHFCHFNPLTFNCCQFSPLLNSNYVLLLIEPKQHVLASFLKKINFGIKKKLMNHLSRVTDNE